MKIMNEEFTFNDMLFAFAISFGCSSSARLLFKLLRRDYAPFREIRRMFDLNAMCIGFFFGHFLW